KLENMEGRKMKNQKGGLIVEPIIQKGGLKTMPFIIANETFEKVATYGLLANMIIYLITGYNMDSATGANVLFIWSAVSNFTPILGAFLSDSYLGRFRVIALGSVASFLGGTLLWLTTVLPEAKPTQNGEQATSAQLSMLFGAFALMSIGAGGIRPCSLAFGADQLDKEDNSAENARVLQTFFNLYYASVGVSIMISVTAFVYIQDKFGFKVGFGIPAALIFLAAVFFLVGSPLYVKVKANKSLFTGFIQTAVVAFKNKHLAFPPNNTDGWYHHRKGSKFVSPTDKLRWLNKACIIRNPDTYAYGNCEEQRSKVWDETETVNEVDLSKSKELPLIVSV
ncbi:NRT1/ PTR FAMILY 1.2 like, partial [Thalictrum thalictroides]